MNEQYNELNNETVSVSYCVAENFDELYEMIRGVDFVDAGLSAEDAVSMIEAVRSGEMDIEDVPENFDLRDTVKKLLEKDTPEEVAA